MSAMMSKTDQATEQLQRMIEHGDLQPGSMVSESQLVEIDRTWAHPDPRGDPALCR